MRTSLRVGMFFVALMLVGQIGVRAEDKKEVPPVLNFTMKSLAGEDVALSKYQGKVIVMVNTASKCGYTKQYADLQKLHEKYKDKGAVVIGFPSNDFKNQEPGTDEDIAAFCTKNYGVTFDMFSKIVVKGPEKVALYKYLTDEATDPKHPGEVAWNFEKFVIGKDGKVAGRFLSKVTPMSDEMIKTIEAELAK